MVSSSGNEARIFGRATLNGAGNFPFVLDVADLGEPGVGADGLRLRLNGAIVAEGVISRGNIQVHKIK